MMSIIIPVPMVTHGGGHIDHKSAIGFYLALNLIMILIYFGLSIAWWFDRNINGGRYNFFGYVFFAHGEETETISDINGICFALVNGMGIIIALAQYITSLL